MRKRGKYGLTNVIDTCKIGSFLSYFVGNLEWGFLKLPSSRDAAAAWTICYIAAAGPAAPAGNQSGSMIYYNRKTWFGVMQYRNGVIHKIFVNVFGKNFLVWYNKE